MESLQPCTLATSYSQWLPHGICRTSPVWNISERRTVASGVLLRPIDSGVSEPLLNRVGIR